MGVGVLTALCEPGHTLTVMLEVPDNIVYMCMCVNIHNCDLQSS